MQKTPQQLFEIMDKDESGYLDHDEFSKSIPIALNIQLEDMEIQALLDYIDSDGNGTIETEEFIEKLQTLQYKKYNKDDWTCTKSEFLTALADVYDKKKAKDFELVANKFKEYDDNGDGFLQEDEFKNAIKSFDIQSELSEKFISRIYLEGVNRSKVDGVKQKVMFYLLQKYAIGNIGIKSFEANKIVTGIDRGEEKAEGISAGKGVVKVKAISRRASLLRKEDLPLINHKKKASLVTPMKKKIATTTSRKK